VRAADGAPADVALRQVAPGRYEATVVADASRPLEVTLADAHPGDVTGVASRVVLPDAAAEYRFRAADEPRLRSLALATGGAWRPGPEALASAAGDRRTERRPIWPTLIIIALCLWFVDLLLRRVRVFEPKAG
jgi:hypothetical protein